VQGKPKTGLNLFGDDPVTDTGSKGWGVGARDVDLDAVLDGDVEPLLGDVDDDWIIDDIGGGAMNDRVGGGGTERDGYVKEMGRCFHITLLSQIAKLQGVIFRFTVSITKAQPPFQPGSTPMENRKRYLGVCILLVTTFLMLS
jgi:chromosome transmission fidelity protein 4